MEERTELTRFLEEKTSFYFPAGAAAGKSEARQDELKIRLGGRNQLKRARPKASCGGESREMSTPV
jgi:hypothetical protein